MPKLKSLLVGALALLLVSFVLLSGCETSSKTKQRPAETEKRSTPKKLSFNEVKPLLNDATPTGSISLSEPRTYSDCFRFFDSPKVTPLKNQVFPFDKDSAADAAFLGCGAEIYEKMPDGTRYIGYGTYPNAKTSARDLEVRKYLPDGKLSWSRQMGRQSEASNFTANYRKSFLTHNQNGTVCFGTMWEGSTQTQCVDDTTGELKWNGKLPFWTGLTPTSGDNGFWVADLVSLTKRYPYSGVEMRYFKLPTLGGRSASYVSGKDAFVFASSRETPSIISTINFKDLDASNFKPAWTVALDSVLTPSYGYLFDNFGLTILKTDDNVFALDSRTGALKWTFKSSSALPQFLENDGHLYTMMRDGTDLNLVELDPKTGHARWQVEVPSPILSIHSLPSGIYLKSVRAVQRVKSLNPPS